MNFLREKLFMILCFAVVALGIGVFVIGYLVSSGNQTALQKIEREILGAGGLGNQLVHEDEIGNYQNRVDQYEQVLEEAQARIKQTSARPVLFPDVFKEDIGNNYSYYSRFADQYCQFVENLVFQLGARDKPSEAEEELVRQKRLNEQVGGVPAGNESEQSKIETLIVDDRKTRAESILTYATSSIFCCYNHWATSPSSTDHSVMLNDIWYTQVAAWIQEDAVGIIKQFNEDFKTASGLEKESVYNSPVKRIMTLGFNGSAPSSEGGQSSRAGGSSGGRIAAAQSDDTKTLPQYVVVSVPITTVMPTMSTGIYGGIGGDPPLGGDPPIGGGLDPPVGGGLDPPVGGGLDPPVGGGVSGVASAYPTAVPVVAPVVAPAPAPPKGGMIDAAPLRASDNLVNVVHFSLTVMIDSSKIHDFINALQTTQLQSSILSADSSDSYERNQITVLQMEIDSVDIAAENREGYYYGSASVKKLSLICEYVFFQSGYEAYMPASIRSIF